MLAWSWLADASQQAISQGGSSMPYAVTKAAQLQLVKCLAVTVGPKIRVNTVLPGLLLTEWVCTPYSFQDASRDMADTRCNLGQQVSRRAHPAHKGHGGVEARDVFAGLCGCIRDAGAEH
jgi:NAD(P)-dependent dehydrogenase (short-subunit alcohol dehydrogenase family)